MEFMVALIKQTGIAVYFNSRNFRIMNQTSMIFSESLEIICKILTGVVLHE